MTTNPDPMPSKRLEALENLASLAKAAGIDYFDIQTTEALALVAAYEEAMEVLKDAEEEIRDLVGQFLHGRQVGWAERMRRYAVGVQEAAARIVREYEGEG